MGVVAARLVFLGFIGLTGSIIYNALYLQDLPGSTAVKAGARSAAPRVETANLPPVRTDLPPLQVEEGGPRLLVRAVQRELADRGFDVGTADGRLSDKTRAAISAYQGAHNLPVTGEASDELLRHILLGERPQPAGATGSVGKTGKTGKTGASDEPDVKAVQQILADLGYAPGPIDGAAGEATRRAIIAFQRDRDVTETGRITPELMAELQRVTGEDLTHMAAER